MKRFVVAIAVLGIASACGEGEAPRAGSKPAPREAASAAASAVPTGVVPGEFVVSVVGGRVQLASREASRLAILRRLADLEGFEFQQVGLAPRKITLQLDDVALATALDALLDDTSYRSDFEYDANLGRSRLAALKIGRARSARAVAGNPDGPERGRKRRLKSLEDITPKVRRTADAEIGEEEARWLEALDSPNDRERREAAEEVDVDGPGLARLLELSQSDPDPQVRTTAVARLEDSGTFAATQGMLRALKDGDSRVVLRAIEALEFAGDETILSELEPLLQHSSPAVRSAAKEAIEFLE